MTKNLLLILFTLSSVFYSSCTVLAQKTGIPAKADKYFQDARIQYIEGDTLLALESLDKALKKHAPFVEAIALKGKLQTELKQYDAAKDTYRKIGEFEEKSMWKVYYQLGLVEMKRPDYQQAIAEFDQAINGGNTPEKILMVLKQYKEICEFRIKAVKSPVEFNPTSLGDVVNSTDDEYLPTLTIDGEQLFFTRKIGKGRTANEDFFVTQKVDGQWETPFDLEEPINKESSQEGALSISPDGNRLFYAANDPLNPGGFDIYYSYKKNGKWIVPFNIGLPINTRHWESQPSISADGKQLYFASKRPGGEGGIDIWVSELKDNQWQRPINLGPEINTPEDEQCPFIHPDGQTLYFSSKGHLGMGDADLFKASKKLDGTWSAPENLGYPINTSKNENSLIVDANGTTAYYSQYVNGKGFDLFSFELPEQLQPVFTTYVQGNIFDAGDNNVKLNANVSITDVASGTVVSTIESNPDGTFIISLPVGKNYAFAVEKKGYVFYSDNFSLEEKSEAEAFLLDIPLSKIKETVIENLVLENVFFDSGSYELLPTSFSELDKLLSLLSSSPTMKIVVEGHTDNVGEPTSNLKLSQKRADSVLNYLVGNGIAANRINAIGKGETNPIADNETKEGRAKNRRTEIVFQ